MEEPTSATYWVKVLKGEQQSTFAFLSFNANRNGNDIVEAVGLHFDN